LEPTPKDWIDVRSGLIGGTLLATIVWLINASHGVVGASTAALKQFAYTFLMGGLVMRLCTHLALSGTSDGRARLLATAVPSVLTVCATLVVHSLRGTPEPLASTVPAAILSPISFGLWARRARRFGRSPWATLTSSTPPDTTQEDRE